MKSFDEYLNENLPAHKQAALDAALKRSAEVDEIIKKERAAAGHPEPGPVSKVFHVQAKHKLQNAGLTSAEKD